MSASYQRRELLELQVNINNNIAVGQSSRCYRRVRPLGAQVATKMGSLVFAIGNMFAVASQRSLCDKASANAAVQMQSSFGCKYYPMQVELRCDKERKANTD